MAPTSLPFPVTQAKSESEHGDQSSLPEHLSLNEMEQPDIEDDSVLEESVPAAYRPLVLKSDMAFSRYYQKHVYHPTKPLANIPPMARNVYYNATKCSLFREPQSKGQDAGHLSETRAKKTKCVEISPTIEVRYHTRKAFCHPFIRRVNDVIIM